MQQRWIVPLALVGGTALGVAGFAFLRGGSTGPAAAKTTPTTPSTSARTITVDASGSVKGRPDMATVYLGVQVEKPTAQEALADASTKSRILIDTLKAQGVKDDDITTAELSLWPRTDNEGTQILGYTASNTVSAAIRDITKAGAVIDAAAKTAGNDIRLNGISFSISDTTALAAAARDQAVGRAKVQADGLAKAAGVKAGPVTAVSTVSYDLPQPEVFANSGSRDAAAAVPIQPGTQDVTARVTVVFELTA